MKRRLILALSTLFIVAALSVDSRTVCAFGFCEDCVGSCYNEGASIYNQYRDNGGSVEACEKKWDQYFCFCQTMFCAGCQRSPSCGPIN